jgi:hypothetical protein
VCTIPLNRTANFISALVELIANPDTPGLKAQGAEFAPTKIARQISIAAVLAPELTTDTGATFAATSIVRGTATAQARARAPTMDSDATLVLTTIVAQPKQSMLQRVCGVILASGTTMRLE